MVNGRLIALLSAALLAVGLVAGPVIAQGGDVDDGDTRSSSADISLVDCVVESSKDISYVALLDGGEELDKFEVDQPTYDLSDYDDIADVTSIEVKSGQTVESFGISGCEDDTAGTDDDTTGDDDTTTGDQGDDTTGDDTDDDATGDDDVAQPDSVEHHPRANENSRSTITLSGCVVNSTKDISSVTFFVDGNQADKIEDVDRGSFDLDSYAGIQDVDSVRVKSGTTVASFSVVCGDPTAGTDDDDTTNVEEDDDDSQDDATWDDHDGDDAKEQDDSDEFMDDRDESTHDRDDDSDDTDSDDTETDDTDSDDTDSDDTDSDDTETDDADSDDDETDDAEWDARHDDRHEHKDHQEIEHEDR